MSKFGGTFTQEVIGNVPITAECPLCTGRISNEQIRYGRWAYVRHHVKSFFKRIVKATCEHCEKTFEIIQKSPVKG